MTGNQRPKTQRHKDTTKRGAKRKRQKDKNEKHKRKKKTSEADKTKGSKVKRQNTGQECKKKRTRWQKDKG